MGFIQIKLPKRIKHKIENSKRNREALTKYFTNKGFTISNSRNYYNENSENYSPPVDYIHVDKELIAISS